MLKHVRYSARILRLGFEQQFSNYANTPNFRVKTYVTCCKRDCTPSINIPKDVRYFSSADNSSKDGSGPLHLHEGLDVQKITGGNPELEHKLKILLLEAEVMRQEGYNIPSSSTLKEHHWQELLSKETKSARRKFFEFMFKIEKKKANRQIKKELKHKEREENPREPVPEGALIYDLSHNNMLLRIYDSTMDMYNNWKVIQAMMFGQKLIIDCGYSKEMTTRENQNCAKQLMFVFSENRKHDDPFDIHFCNAKKGDVLIDSLERQIPTMYEPWFPMNIHETSYLDLFPKEKLVYLTPHCREVLKEYNHDDIYIIGALVDKINREPYSLAKAKREGLRMAKLPLDYYLQWGSGSGKSLTVNQVTSILLDMKVSGDWKYALRHVPRRKLTDVNPEITFSNVRSRLSYDNEPDYIRTKNFSSWRPKRLLGDESDKGKRSTKTMIDLRKVMND